jgi:anti-anti-sigma regulatory factor
MVEAMHLTAIGSGKVLLEPELGLDPAEPDRYLEPLIQHLQAMQASRLLYDLKKIPLIDEVYYQWLLTLYNACRICGIELVTVNIGAAAAFGLAMNIDKLPPFTCARDVNAVG